MTANHQLTQTRDDLVLDDASTTGSPRLIRFFRADRPSEGPEEFTLLGHERVSLGRGESVRTEGHAESRISSRDDALMSSRHALLTRSAEEWSVADCASKNGLFVNGARAEKPQPLADGDVLECGNSFFMYRTRSARQHLGQTAKSGAKASPALPPLHYQIAALLPFVGSSMGIHLHGETGTGKEVVACAIHDLSGRPGAFVPRNCAAIPDALFESELFGHTKGAFSGASANKRGQILAADGGTLFLDEIAELSLPMQAKLLRVLESKEVLPVGATKTIPVDFRLVSATLCNLPEMVADGRFRRDLYARLGQTFAIPPLRDVKEHLGVLIPSLLAATKHPSPIPLARIRFTIGAGRAIVRHSWPLNVRELKQCLESALTSVASEGPADAWTIDLRHLPNAVRVGPGRGGVDATRPGLAARRGQGTPTSDDEVLAALDRVDGNRGEAARLLGVSERTIFRRLSKLKKADGPK